ncbi:MULTISPECIES: phosphodiester glycosidase family protein [unclassified Synechococcus]|uniref:phosphodiester glycosidase family protein n=1 Tax=unclassified Synechococcus TaxID=2626047 RepID=UPI0020CC5E0F|nr:MULTISPECIES: phosphodiester glycosidase family protein [unclassified Synechococcus]
MAGLLTLLPVMPVAASLAALLAGVPLTAPPPLLQPRSPDAQRARLPQAQGTEIQINSLRQQARWQVQTDPGTGRVELWIPLEVLQGQLGVSSRSSSDNTLELEWFGQRQRVPSGAQRSLDDEVAVPASTLLESAGVQLKVQGNRLNLELPPAPLHQVRWREQGPSRRVVLDLSTPALVRSDATSLLVGVQATAEQLQQLQGLGLTATQTRNGLQLRAAAGGAPRLLTLAAPWRLVLDLPAGTATSPSTATATAPPPPDPRLQALLGQGLQMDRRIVRLGNQQVLMSSVRFDPRATPLDLRPLNRPDGMQGLSSLTQLARSEQALIAVNGGYFNRVNRLPLGALRDNGRWLSGPILNRGAMGWSQASLPSFGRLSLEDTIVDSSGQRWPVLAVNSGYVQRGLSRYTADWGRSYQAISGTEMGVLVRNGSVSQRFELGQLDGGVPLAQGDLLLVARGGLNLPWMPGERVSLNSRPSNALGELPYAMGGGPLLLQDSQVVLNGAAEGFSSGFLSQGAPRTVVGSDGHQLWLVTLQGVSDAGPTLLQSAQLLKQLGLRDALNLDGGSSTGLVVGDTHTVKGRGVVAAVHNGLGLIPRDSSWTLQRPTGPLTAGPQ